MSDNKEQRIIIRIACVTVAINLALAVIKALAGIMDNSKAMISDAANSASDIFITFIAIAGVLIAGRKEDKGHRYGHERMECVAAILLAAILFAVGAGIGYDGVSGIISGSYKNAALPGLFALFTALGSIAVKEIMFWFVRHYARKYNSIALKADAWNHRSDSIASLGSFIGVGGAMLGYAISDTIASIVSCLFIIHAAYSVFKEAIDKLVDKACGEDIVNNISTTALSVDGVLRIDDLKTRVFGNKIYVDMEIAVSKMHSIESAHDISEKVHDVLEHQISQIKHCMIHINPSDCTESCAEDDKQR